MSLKFSLFFKKPLCRLQFFSQPIVKLSLLRSQIMLLEMIINLPLSHVLLLTARHYASKSQVLMFCQLMSFQLAAIREDFTTFVARQILMRMLHVISKLAFSCKLFLTNPTRQFQVDIEMGAFDVLTHVMLSLENFATIFTSESSVDMHGI